MPVRPAGTKCPRHCPTTRRVRARLRTALPSAFFLLLWAALPPGLAAQNNGGDLASLCRALREKDTPANYERLAAFAREHSGESPGQEAALALGYRDYTRGHFEQAAAWLRQAEANGRLADYALYWEAQNDHAQHRAASALDRLERLAREYPSSALLPQALEALAGLALDSGQPQRARFALENYKGTAQRPALLLLRARARELDRTLTAAADDYVTVYYRYPLSVEAKRAGERIGPLQNQLRSEFPQITPQMRFARVEAFYETHQWSRARAEYSSIAKFLSGADRERSLLRAAACATEPRGGPGPLQALRLSDAELDAERYALLAGVYRRKKMPEAMDRAADTAVNRAPHSSGAAAALLEAGNYYWMRLDRANAAERYRRAYEADPTSSSAETAQWRLAWTAYLDRDAQAAALLEAHLRQFPNSSYVAEALYWLGRSAERSGDPSRARAFFLKLASRFPQNYWGAKARGRLAELGASGAAPPETIPVLAVVPAPKPLPGLNAPLPSAAQARVERAQTLRTIGFDASADLELRAGYAETGAASLLVQVAEADLAAGRYGAAMVTIRQAVPQLEARRWEELPASVWAAAFPMPYAEQIRTAAERQGLDPMLVAGLIRQESAFQPRSVSRAKAIGLMQVLPGTGKRLARQLRMPYSRAKLFEPEYNLRLGTKYLADLIAMFGGEVEPALAAYDAGEDRIAGWQTERKFDEMAEFIESIPITETREYVQIVSRNASVYRRLGGSAQ
jgi:soluble lytic murein transglycosylase